MLIREAEEADAPGIAWVQVDSWRTTYRGVVPDGYIDSLTYEKREARWREFLATTNDHFAFVAVSEGKRVVDFASGGRNRGDEESYRGELYAIYLLKAFQRRGVGRLLVRATAGRLLERGVSSMLVWVLAENPSRAFYESLGARRVAEKEVVIGGAPLAEVAYG